MILEPQIHCVFFCCLLLVSMCYWCLCLIYWLSHLSTVCVVFLSISFSNTVLLSWLTSIEVGVSNFLYSRSVTQITALQFSSIIFKSWLFLSLYSLPQLHGMLYTQFLSTFSSNDFKFVRYMTVTWICWTWFVVSKKKICETIFGKNQVHFLFVHHKISKCVTLPFAHACL